MNSLVKDQEEIEEGKVLTYFRFCLIFIHIYTCTCTEHILCITHTH